MLRLASLLSFMRPGDGSYRMYLDIPVGSLRDLPYFGSIL